MFHLSCFSSPNFMSNCMRKLCVTGKRMECCELWTLIRYCSSFYAFLVSVMICYYRFPVILQFSCSERHFDQLSLNSVLLIKSCCYALNSCLYIIVCIYLFCWCWPLTNLLWYCMMLFDYSCWRHCLSCNHIWMHCWSLM